MKNTKIFDPSEPREPETNTRKKSETRNLENPRRRGLAISALIFGIVAFLIGLVPILGFIVGVVSLVFAIAALARRQSKGMAITGLSLGAFGSFVSLLVFVVAVGGAMSDPSAPADTSASSTDVDVEPDIPAGFKDAGTGIAYRNATEGNECSYRRCVFYELFAYEDCPTSVYVEANTVDKESQVVYGFTNDTLGSLLAGQRAIVELTILEDQANAVRLTKVSCY